MIVWCGCHTSLLCQVASERSWWSLGDYSTLRVIAWPFFSNLNVCSKFVCPLTGSNVNLAGDLLLGGCVNLTIVFGRAYADGDWVMRKHSFKYLIS